MGDWAKIIGVLRKRPSVASIAALSALALVYVGTIFYLRTSNFSGTSQAYLYLEVGCTLLSFCYAANALVRFRGTHDRTALILAFGFVLSGMIETIGYFSLNGGLHGSAAALAHIPLGWMVSRTLLAVLLLAALAVERFMPTARQPSKEIARTATNKTEMFDVRLMVMSVRSTVIIRLVVHTSVHGWPL